MIIKCTKCNSEFDMKKVKLKNKYLGAMYTEVFYNCPKCKAKHFVCVMSAKSRNLKSKIESLSIETYMNNINNGNDKAIETLMSAGDITKLQEEYKQEIDRINRGLYGTNKASSMD